MHTYGNVVCLALDLYASPIRRAGLIDVRSLSGPVRLEPGCLGCEISIEESVEAVIHYRETWPSEDAMRRRVRSGPFTRLLALMETADRPPVVEFDLVTERRGLDYVAEVREDFA